MSATSAFNLSNSVPCLLLAAGRGERMRPLTDTIPKPLLEVHGKSLLAWHLEGLAKFRIQQVVINHAWLGEQIEAAFGTGESFGLHIDYSKINILRNRALQIPPAVSRAVSSLE